jgi:hypothetical protein
MAAPFLIPAGMTALKIGGKWVLKKLAKRSAKKERKRDRKRRGVEKEEKKKEARRYQKTLETPASKLKKRDVKKKLKEGAKKAKTRRMKSEKDLERVDFKPRSPTITRVEAVARATAKKKDVALGKKKMELGSGGAGDKIRATFNKVLADFHKANPRPLGGPGNAYGHGKGIGAKLERIGLSKKSIQKERQLKRENKQVAKQRRQRGEPERREVRRPKSGLYKDTPKKKIADTPKKKPESKMAKRTARQKILSAETKKAILKKATKQEKKRLKEKATPPFKEKQFNKKWQRDLAKKADEFGGEKPLNPELAKKLKAHTIKKRKRANKLTADAKRRRN